MVDSESLERFMSLSSTLTDLSGAMELLTIGLRAVK